MTIHRWRKPAIFKHDVCLDGEDRGDLVGQQGPLGLTPVDQEDQSQGSLQGLGWGSDHGKSMLLAGQDELAVLVTGRSVALSLAAASSGIAPNFRHTQFAWSKLRSGVVGKGKTVTTIDIRGICSGEYIRKSGTPQKKKKDIL